MFLSSSQGGERPVFACLSHGGEQSSSHPSPGEKWSFFSLPPRGMSFLLSSSTRGDRRLIGPPGRSEKSRPHVPPPHWREVGFATAIHQAWLCLQSVLGRQRRGRGLHWCLSPGGQGSSIVHPPPGGGGSIDVFVSPLAEAGFIHPLPGTGQF